MTMQATKKAYIARGTGANSAKLAAGAAPRAVGEAGTRRVLEWCYRWGWGAPSTLDYLALDRGRRGKAARLVERGFFEEHKSNSYASDAPRKVLTITEKGLEELTILGGAFNPELINAKIKWQQLRHDYIVQNIVAEYHKKHGYSYISERMMQLKIASSEHKMAKIPDAIIYKKDTPQIAIELELTPKKDFEMHRLAMGYILLKRHFSVGHVIVHSPSRAILQYWREFLVPGRRLRRIKVDEKGRLQDRGWHDEKVGESDYPHFEYVLLKSLAPDFSEKELLGIYQKATP